MTKTSNCGHFLKLPTITTIEDTYYINYRQKHQKRQKPTVHTKKNRLDRPKTDQKTTLLFRFCRFFLNTGIIVDYFWKRKRMRRQTVVCWSSRRERTRPWRGWRMQSRPRRRCWWRWWCWRCSCRTCYCSHSPKSTLSALSWYLNKVSCCKTQAWRNSVYELKIEYI